MCRKKRTKSQLEKKKGEEEAQGKHGEQGQSVTEKDSQILKSETEH